jgi:hypothetical protein
VIHINSPANKFDFLLADGSIAKKGIVDVNISISNTYLSRLMPLYNETVI